jgi:hypothetical protein
MAAKVPLEAFKRVPFVDDVAILGPNYTGAAFSMHIRNRNGDTGTPIVSLANAAVGVQGISVTYIAAYAYNEAGAVAPASLILIQIDEATLEALALNNPSNEPVVLNYDLHVTPVGGVKRVELLGTFTINPGATI